MKLTANFSLEEFEASQTATRLGIDNRVPAESLPYIKETAEMLQRIRDFLTTKAGHEVPITVTSGYRCLLLNRTQGSKDTSDHIKGMAADWRAPKFGTPTEICRALVPEIQKLEIGQLINEFPDRNGWIHTSIRTSMHALNRIITITTDGTQVGIVGGSSDDDRKDMA